MGRSIGRAPGKFLQLRRYANDRVAERQLSAELMKLVKIKTRHARVLCMRNVSPSTSAVTKGLPSRSPPIQLPIRRNDASSTRRVGRISGLEIVLHALNRRADLPQKRVIVIGQAVRHFVEHRELVPAQHACLPQGQHGLPQPFVAGCHLLMRKLDAFAPVQ